LIAYTYCFYGSNNSVTKGYVFTNKDEYNRNKGTSPDLRDPSFHSSFYSICENYTKEVSENYTKEACENYTKELLENGAKPLTRNWKSTMIDPITDEGKCLIFFPPNRSTSSSTKKVSNI